MKDLSALVDFPGPGVLRGVICLHLEEREWWCVVLRVVGPFGNKETMQGKVMIVPTYFSKLIDQKPVYVVAGAGVCVGGSLLARDAGTRIG